MSACPEGRSAPPRGRPQPRSRGTRLLSGLGLLAAWTLVPLLLVECTLRAHGRYEYAADAVHEVDGQRIWSRRPHVSYVRHHPDTGRPHRVINNNLAMRQHRPIDPVAAPGEIRIGFFGDSMTENLRLPAPHGFTEVLDHLLSLHPGRFTVLNFGVDGYGTDQSYVYWATSPLARELDHVVYVFLWNDVMNLYENDLFELGDDGALQQKGARPTPGWISALSRLHLTYLAIEGWQRLRPAPRQEGETRPAVDAEQARRTQAGWRRRHLDRTAAALALEARRGWRSERGRSYVALLQRLVSRWRAEVERAGARFHVVLAPARWEANYAALFEGYDVVDLGRAFEEDGLGLAWKFQNDEHWNELGNQLAAVHLLRHFEESLGLPSLDEGTVQEELYRYYHAFDLAWKPSRWVKETKVDPAVARRIRARYTALESTPPAPRSP